MKVPNIFVPEKDLTKSINKYLEEKPVSLYDHVKSVYEGSGDKNMFLLYGPPGTGKTFTSNKTKEELSKEYDISHIRLQPIDAVDIYAVGTKILSKYFKKIEDEIASALSANKKVYIDIHELEKFNKLAQEAIDNILMTYKANRNIVFVFQSYYKYPPFFQEEQTIDIKFTQKRL